MNLATISPDGRYRYWLRRVLDGGAGEPGLLFIMLNPSTADATTDDPTIRRCVGFTRREGFNTLEVVNLYAWRATDPRALWNLPDGLDPVGPANDGHILDAATRAMRVVAAWGRTPPRAWPRAAVVTGKLEREGIKLHCLGRTADGSPRHPLMLRADAPLTPWSLL